jgi:outer membrane protein assembly factor BamB
MRLDFSLNSKIQQINFCPQFKAATILGNSKIDSSISGSWIMSPLRIAVSWSILISISVSAICIADDWPQFLGHDRSGVSRESIPLIDAFPPTGPKVVWKVAGGVGMSGIAVAGSQCLTIVNREGNQTLISLDRKTGNEMWSTAFAPEYKNPMGDGTRATPTIHASRVVCYSGEGILVCHELASGKQLWKKNLLQELGAKPSEYGMSCSPLVFNNTIICHVGADEAAVAATDIDTGNTKWTAGKGRAGYSSPAMITIDGREQVVAFVGSQCIGIEPTSGKVLWEYPFVTDYDCNTATPAILDGKLLISAGENHGSVLLQIAADGDGYSVKEVWRSLGTGSALRSEWQTPLVTGNVIFGFDNVGAAGPITNLTCIDATSGAVLWKQMRFGKSNGILADKKLVIATLEGELVLVRARPDKFEELARSKLIGKTRQAPALADGYLYLRDDEHVVCIDLRK